MENNEKYIMEILQHHCDVVKTEKDARDVLNTIKEIGYIKDLSYFIESDMCLFKDKTDAYDWFCGEEDLLTILEDIPLTIRADMVGKDLGDIIIDEILNYKENYIKVNDNLHLTYWM